MLKNIEKTWMFPSKYIDVVDIDIDVSPNTRTLKRLDVFGIVTVCSGAVWFLKLGFIKELLRVTFPAK